MTRRAAAVLAAAMTATSLTGCTGNSDPPQSGPQTITIEVSYDDFLNQNHITRDLTLKVGDALQVSLGANPSTGFGWTPEMQITNPAVLAQTGHEELAPSTGRPGASAREVWVMQTMATGATSVSTAYGRPWPGGEKDAWTFSAQVTVT
jgi:inhibitor of cysteine peptidase